MNNLFVQLKKNWTLHTQALETQAQIINAAIRSQISREEKKKKLVHYIHTASRDGIYVLNKLPGSDRMIFGPRFTAE